MRSSETKYFFFLWSRLSLHHSLVSLASQKRSRTFSELGVTENCMLGHATIQINSWNKQKKEHRRIFINPSLITLQLSRSRVPFLTVLTHAACMNFTTVTSTHVCADYLTFEELRGSYQGVRSGAEGLANNPAGVLGGHLITSDTETARQF